jgi:hypothetical protein
MTHYTTFWQDILFPAVSLFTRAVGRFESGRVHTKSPHFHRHMDMTSPSVLESANVIGYHDIFLRNILCDILSS